MEAGSAPALPAAHRVLSREQALPPEPSQEPFSWKLPGELLAGIELSRGKDLPQKTCRFRGEKKSYHIFEYVWLTRSDAALFILQTVNQES